MLNQVVRYAPVVELVEEAGGRTLLEVGSGSRGIVPYLRGQWRVTAADVDFSDYGAVDRADAPGADRVVADVRELPFPDAAFDAVVAVDLLEHVAPAERARAVAELTRVARRRTIVACPCGDAALESDRRLARFYERIGHRPPQWLVEHLAHGFPQREELRAAADGRASVRLLRNEWVRAHGAIARIEAFPRLALASALAGDRLRRGLGSPSAARRRSARAAVAALRAWDRPPAYRAILVIDAAAS